MANKPQNKAEYITNFSLSMKPTSYAKFLEHAHKMGYPLSTYVSILLEEDIVEERYSVLSSKMKVRRDKKKAARQALNNWLK